MYVKCFESSTSTKGVMHRATSWEKATCGITCCRTSSGQQHGDRPQYEKTSIHCKSLVHREGVDDDLMRGHEKTVPFEGVDDDPRRGHEKTVPIRRESPGPP